MRVTADLFVSAMLRRVFSSGGFAAVVKRGALEAGAVFIIVRQASGEAMLLGPAPQTSYDQARPDDRVFLALMTGSDDEIGARLEREERFDSDIWVVEIEPGSVAVGELVSVVTP